MVKIIKKTEEKIWDILRKNQVRDTVIIKVRLLKIKIVQVHQVAQAQNHVKAQVHHQVAQAAQIHVKAQVHHQVAQAVQNHVKAQVHHQAAQVAQNHVKAQAHHQAAQVAQIHVKAQAHHQAAQVAQIHVKAQNQDAILVRSVNYFKIRKT